MCGVTWGAPQSTSWICDAQILKRQGALSSIIHAGHCQELQLPSAPEKLQLLSAPDRDEGKKSLLVLVCISTRESVASQGFLTKLNVARTDWVSMCHEREGHSCSLCRPNSEASSGKISSPLWPLLALGNYSCVFCSFGTHCLVTSCTAPWGGNVM